MSITSSLYSTLKQTSIDHIHVSLQIEHVLYSLMLVRMLEFLFTPFLLLLFSKKSENNIVPSPRCLSYNESYIFYDHPDPSIGGCYNKWEKAICGENMKLYPINKTRYGECDCDFTSDRILVYHNETRQCYPIYTQGYCKPGKWIVITRESSPEAVCEQNICLEQSPENKHKDFVPLSNGTCAEVDSICEPYKIVGFEPDKLVAGCKHRRRLRGFAPPDIRCRKGTYRTMTGQCQPPISWFD